MSNDFRSNIVIRDEIKKSRVTGKVLKLTQEELKQKRKDFIKFRNRARTDRTDEQQIALKKEYINDYGSGFPIASVYFRNSKTKPRPFDQISINPLEAWTLEEIVAGTLRKDARYRSSTKFNNPPITDGRYRFELEYYDQEDGAVKTKSIEASIPKLETYGQILKFFEQEQSLYWAFRLNSGEALDILGVRIFPILKWSAGKKPKLNRLLDGPTHCVFSPMIRFYKSKIESGVGRGGKALSESTIKNYKTRVKSCENFLETYSNGISVENMNEVAKKLRCKISITDVNGEELFKSDVSGNTENEFNYIYSDHNHVSIDKCDTITALALDVIENGYDPKKHVLTTQMVKCGSYLNGKNQLTAPESKIMDLWHFLVNNKIFFKCYSNKINQISKLIFNGHTVHLQKTEEHEEYRKFMDELSSSSISYSEENKMYDLIRKCYVQKVQWAFKKMPKTNKNLMDRDMTKAYTQSEKCPYYLKFPSKLHHMARIDFLEVDKTLEFVKQNVGFYCCKIEIDETKLYKVDKVETDVIEYRLEEYLDDNYEILFDTMTRDNDKNDFVEMLKINFDSIGEKELKCIDQRYEILKIDREFYSNAIEYSKAYDKFYKKTKNGERCIIDYKTQKKIGKLLFDSLKERDLIKEIDILYKPVKIPIRINKKDIKNEINKQNKDKTIYLEKLGIANGQYYYFTSPFIWFLIDKFDLLKVKLVYGAWSEKPSHLIFSENMKTMKINKVSLYSHAVGSMAMEREYKEHVIYAGYEFVKELQTKNIDYNFREISEDTHKISPFRSEDEHEQLNSFCEIRYNTPLKEEYKRNHKHIATYVIQYNLITMLCEAMKYDVSNLYAIKVDALLIKKSINALETDLFKNDKTKNPKLLTSPCHKFFEGQSKFPIEFNIIQKGFPIIEEFITGPGGCGKSYEFCEKHSGFNYHYNEMLYCCPTNKLLQNKKKKYYEKYSKELLSCTIAKLLGGQNFRSFEEETHSNFSTIFVDESTMITESVRKRIVHKYPTCKIYFAGDFSKIPGNIAYQTIIVGKYATDPLSLFKGDKVRPHYEFTIDRRSNEGDPIRELKSELRTCMDQYRKPDFVQKILEKYIKVNRVKFESLDSAYKDGDICISFHREEPNKLVNNLLQNKKPIYRIKKSIPKTDICTGDILYSDKTEDGKQIQESYIELRRCFTAHSIQGETIEQPVKIFILVNDLLTSGDYRPLYTAISRARSIDQIVLVTDTPPEMSMEKQDFSELLEEVLNQPPISKEELKKSYSWMTKLVKPNY